MGRGGGPGAYSGGGGGYGDYSQGGYNQGYSPRGRGGGAAGYGSEVRWKEMLTSVSVCGVFRCLVCQFL